MLPIGVIVALLVIIILSVCGCGSCLACAQCGIWSFVFRVFRYSGKLFIVVVLVFNFIWIIAYSADKMMGTSLT